MAKLYGKNGELIRLLQTDEEELHFGDPSAFDDLIEFDPETNQDMIAGLNTDWNSHKIVGGALHRNNQPVTINPTGSRWNARLNQEEARTRFLLSQLANKTPSQIYTQMQERMDSWTSLADAREDLREWLPLFGALLAWKVVDQ